MKYLSLIFRVIVVGAGLTLSGFAVYLGWQTLDYLKKDFIPHAERLFQETRLGAHVIAFVLGLALVILAIPRRRTEPVPTLRPTTFRYRIFTGIGFLLIFITSCLSYIRELGRKPFKPDEDITTKVAVVLFWLFIAVLCFKWKPSAAKKPEPDAPAQ